MVVLELDVGDELAVALEAEAEQFEFETTTAYLHWLVRNRSVVFDQSDDALGQRLARIEQRLEELESDRLGPESAQLESESALESESNLDPEGDHDIEAAGEVMDAVDDAFEETTGADDEEVSEAIASIEIEDDPDG